MSFAEQVMQTVGKWNAVVMLLVPTENSAVSNNGIWVECNIQQVQLRLKIGFWEYDEIWLWSNFTPME